MGLASHIRAGREVRDLNALMRTGSSGRVINLLLVEEVSGFDPEYVKQPLFMNKTLNTSIIVKHRVRADERYVFDGLADNATKVIVPFANGDLSLGGRSMFVGQRGWREMLDDLCANSADLERDARVLTLIDQLPSLDPFLVREHLRRHGFEVARCYFAISNGDHARMQAFVRREVSKLVELAFSESRNTANDTAKLVEILLSSASDVRFEPLRQTLGLDGEAYKEGVFSWKGFLYYKWMLGDLWPKLEDVVQELRSLQITGKRDFETLRYVDMARPRLAGAIHKRRREVLETLGVYDEAFVELTEKRNPAAFREFLVQAPSLFFSLGERIGGIAHVASFWRYCFANPSQPVTLEALSEILQEFEASLAIDDDAPPPKAAALL
jgi:hypothetical protein